MTSTVASSTTVGVPDDERNLDIQPVLRTIDLQSKSHYLKNEFVLIWLDAQIDSSPDCQHAKARLRLVVNTLKTFIVLDDCLAFLHAIENEGCQQQLCLIVSGSLSKRLVPTVTDLPHVAAVAIYCFSPEKYELNVEITHHPKVVGFFVELDPLLVALDARTQSAATVTPLTTGVNTQRERSIKDLSQENATFIWFHLLIHAVLLLPRTDAAWGKMIDECRHQYDDNIVEQGKIDDFRRTYRPAQAVRWYTRDSFVYRLVNRALRTQDIDQILTFYPFIADLHDQLRTLHDEFLVIGPPNELTVYRGQQIHIDELRKITAGVGGLLSMNSFFSTGFNRILARRYAGESASLPPHLASLIYKVKIDTTVRTAPFSNVGEHTFFPSEEEFLFSVDAVFHIQAATQCNDEFGKYWLVELCLIDERNEQELTELLDRYKGEIGKTTSLASLASVLMMMEDYVHAERYCNLLLGELPTNHFDRLVTLIMLGRIADHTNREEEARAHYKQVVKECRPDNIKKKFLLSIALNNLATMHFKAGHYDIAEDKFLQVLQFRETFLSKEHQMLICINSNLAACLKAKGDLHRALKHSEKAFDLCQKLLPENDPERASIEGNLAETYSMLGRQKEAVIHFENAFSIQKRCMPPGHGLLITAHSDMGRVYSNMSEYDQAITHLDSALEIQQRLSTITDPFALSSTLNTFGCVYSEQGRMRDALPYLERAVQLIPRHHPKRVGALKRLATVLGHIGETTAALDAFRQAIALHEQLKDNANELDLAEVFHSMGLLHCRTGELDNADEAYHRALAIRHRLLPAVHPATAKLYNELGGVCLEKGNYEQALNYFQQTRFIELETLPEGDIELARTYHNIGVSLFKMGKSAEALVEEEKALSIINAKQQLGTNHPLLNKVLQTLSEMRAITILGNSSQTINKKKLS